MSFDSGASPGTGSFRRLLRNMRRASEMSNPIRIAQGPPTEEGDYKCRHKQNIKRWHLCRVFIRGSEFPIFWVKIDGKLRLLADMVKAGWQFSTRIPDPEEME